MPGPPPLSIPAAILKILQFERDPLSLMQELHARYGNLSALRSLRKSLVFAFGPEYNQVLHADGDRFASKGFVLAGPADSPQRRLSTSLFTMNGSTHRQARHLLLPPFQRSALAQYQTDLVELLEPLLARWRPGQVIDILHEMHHWSWSIAGKLLYGLDVSAGRDSLRHEFEYWLGLNASLVVRCLRFDWPLCPYRRLLRQANRLEQKILAMIRAKEAAGTRGNDVLAILMRQQVSDAELVGHATTLFLAAFETTANTLAWTFFLLAQHPRVLGELLDELAPLGGAVPSADQLGRFSLLDAVLKESMRLLPAIPFSRRIATKDGMLGPCFLPRGSMVLFSHYITHHMPELYAEPNRFLPERWQTIRPSISEYLPFGAGAHMCVGSSLATFVLKTILAMVLPRWRMTVVPQSRIARRVTVSLAPRHGVPMILAHQDRRFERTPVRGDIHEMVDLQAEERRLVAVAIRSAA
jgi:cytochrome P450